MKLLKFDFGDGRFSQAVDILNMKTALVVNGSIILVARTACGTGTKPVKKVISNTNGIICHNTPLKYSDNGRGNFYPILRLLNKFLNE